jgi:hypothetical protein
VTRSRYAEAMFQCAMNMKVDTQAARLLDWRYFFVDQEGVGHTTCYMAKRQALHSLMIRAQEFENAIQRPWATLFTSRDVGGRLLEHYLQSR